MLAPVFKVVSVEEKMLIIAPSCITKVYYHPFSSQQRRSRKRIAVVLSAMAVVVALKVVHHQ